MIRDEGHGYQQDKNKFDFYRAMEGFFAKNLK
jgi:dipeptidyl aminopeptidase/acylaminoacyl peptidase